LQLFDITLVNVFLISHSSGDIRLLVGHLQSPPTYYYTLIETLLGKCLKRLP